MTASSLLFSSSSPSLFLLVLVLISGALQQRYPSGVVEACGGFFHAGHTRERSPVKQAGLNIAFGVRSADVDVNLDRGEGTSNINATVDVEMTVQINYEGPAEDFAWVVPVPAKPTISISSDILFSALSEATRPTFNLSIDESRAISDSSCWRRRERERNLCGGGYRPAPVEEGIVLETGSIGPFDFVVLDPPDNDTGNSSDPNNVFDWLNTNGYAQPEEAKPLVARYAEMGMQFVALRLQNNSTTGDIQPVTLAYQLPHSLQDNPVGNIPIELTSIAATPDMPIQIYLLGPHRGVAYNFADVEIDHQLIDWWGCFYSSQDCYLESFRNLFHDVAIDVNGHAVITEFAGELDHGENGEVLDVWGLDVEIDIEELGRTTDPVDFMIFLQEAEVPDLPLVHSIIERHIPYGDVPNWCRDGYPYFSAEYPTACLSRVDWDGLVFDPKGLAADLEAEVFQPARDAKEWVGSYEYMSRLYAKLDPEQMDRDPVFAFLPDLSDVPKDVSAVGVPFCDESDSLFLDTYVGDNSDDAPMRVKAYKQNGCGADFWRVRQPPFNGTTSPALSMTKYGFPPDGSLVVFRNVATGNFEADEITDLLLLLENPTLNLNALAYVDSHSGGATSQNQSLWSLVVIVALASLVMSF